MKNKIVYSYDIETSEYLGAITAYESPLEPNVYLMPSQSTEKEPPQTGEHEIAVWSDDSWLIVDDWRGAKGFVNEERIEIKELGPKPENWSETPPLPTLDEAKYSKYAEIANARWQSETGGTTLNGIEIATDRESQAMITGAALQAVVDPNYTCRWKTKTGFIELSAAEIVGIAQAVRSHVQNCFDREAALLSAIDAAETVEAVQAVAWEA